MPKRAQRKLGFFCAYSPASNQSNADLGTR